MGRTPSPQERHYGMLTHLAVTQHAAHTRCFPSAGRSCNVEAAGAACSHVLPQELPDGGCLLLTAMQALRQCRMQRTLRLLVARACGRGAKNEGDEGGRRAEAIPSFRDTSHSHPHPPSCLKRRLRVGPALRPELCGVSCPRCSTGSPGAFCFPGEAVGSLKSTRQPRFSLQRLAGEQGVAWGTLHRLSSPAEGKLCATGVPEPHIRVPRAGAAPSGGPQEVNVSYPGVCGGSRAAPCSGLTA